MKSHAKRVVVFGPQRRVFLMTWGNLSNKCYHEDNWELYILQGDNDILYIGISQNLTKRIQSHERGDRSSASKRLINPKLIRKKKIGSFLSASKVERLLKKSKNPLIFFDNNYDFLVDFSKDLEDSKQESQYKYIHYDNNRRNRALQEEIL